MRIALLGYGKMGREIEKIALEKNDSISFKIRSSNKELINELSKENCDVVIEFSRPESAFENISAALRKGIPVVSGTTAWLDKLEEAKSIALENQTALFYAPNFSLGVNLFFKANAFLAKLMSNFKEYNVSIEEIHHTEKLDAPSGTAIKQAEGILDLRNDLNNWINEETDQNNLLSIISHRKEGVPGTHTTYYSSDIDEISLKHIAHSRKGFALGAWMASHFIQNKKGFYNMDDLLEI